MQGSQNSYISGTFPLCNPGGTAYVEGNKGSYDAFVAKFNSSNQLVWSTQYGGSDAEIPPSFDYVNGINVACDANANIFVSKEPYSL